MIYLADNLRRMRKDAGMTQEEVAVALSVSPQTVSKWERQETMPDITLLPALANLFRVSTDFLLGMEMINSQSAIAGIFNTGHYFVRIGDRKAAAASYEEALKLHPGDPGILCDLAMVLGMADDEPTLLRAAELCRQVLEKDTGKTGHTARAALCYILEKLGRRTDALHISRSLPHQRESREVIQADLNAGLTKDELNGHIRYILLGELPGETRSL